MLRRFHGVLAPNAGLRAAIMPGPPENTSEPADEHADGVAERELRPSAFEKSTDRFGSKRHLKVF